MLLLSAALSLIHIFHQRCLRFISCTVLVQIVPLTESRYYFFLFQLVFRYHLCLVPEVALLMLEAVCCISSQVCSVVIGWTQFSFHLHPRRRQ
jgi:hypothetical protein